MTRVSDATAVAITVVTLAAFGVARSTLVPGSFHFVANTAMIAVVVAAAVAARLSGDEMGLSSDALPAGVRVGGLTALVVGGVVAAGVLVTDRDLPMVRDHIGRSTGDVLVQAFVEIPVATVLLEELAFRGVLGALFHRLLRPGRAVAAASLLFGLWHVPGAASGSGEGHVAGVVGVVVLTTVAGVVFQLMKDRTRSIAAPVIAHWATNGLSLLVVWALAEGR